MSARRSHSHRRSCLLIVSRCTIESEARWFWIKKEAATNLLLSLHHSVSIVRYPELQYHDTECVAVWAVGFKSFTYMHPGLRNRERVPKTKCPHNILYLPVLVILMKPAYSELSFKTTGHPFKNTVTCYHRSEKDFETPVSTRIGKLWEQNTALRNVQDD